MGAVLGSMNYVLEKLWKTARVMMGENLVNYVIEIAKEILDVLLHFGKACKGMVLDGVFPPLQHFGKILIAKVVEVFPTEIITVEQMTYWVQVAAPYIIGAVVVLIILRWFFRGGGGGSVVKMMIAPGTSRAIKIPRHYFEASPRKYFRDLRGK